MAKQHIFHNQSQCLVLDHWAKQVHNLREDLDGLQVLILYHGTYFCSWFKVYVQSERVIIVKSVGTVEKYK